MAKDLGKNVSHTFDNENYSYDSVVFQEGKPPLDSEVNLAQQLLSDLARKTTVDNSSGWVSYKSHFAEPGNPNFFYTQNPSSPLPELALVNGWPIHVTNTDTTLGNVNVVNMDEYPLVTGSRVDGVFLEVWRGLVSDEMTGITTPTDLTQIGVLKSVCAVSENLAWAVGDNGIVLKTDNGGVTWLSQPTPTSVAINAVKFLTASVGYLAGANGTLFKTDNGGGTWTQLAIPALDSLNAISVISGSNIVIVGDNGTILVSENGFDFVLVLNSDGAPNNLNSVFFYDQSIGWAAGDNGQYLRTLDGGQTWTVQPITTADPSKPLQEVTVTNNLKGIRFVNLSDGWVVGDNGMILRTTDGGLRWSDISVSIYNPASETNPNIPAYSKTTQNLNNIEILNSYPVRINLSIRQANIFRSAAYEIGPKNLILTYQDADDFQEHKVTLPLAQYPTDVDLVSAINAVQDADTGEIVFNATLSYTESAYLSHANAATIYGTQSTEIRFSMGDRAWIVGDNGLVLSTQNGGARWVVEDSPTTFNMYGISFTGVDYGWVVGDQGEIARYDASSGLWENQDTDLVKQTQRKVFFEGNNESPADLNLRNDSIHPGIKTETSARTQVQYRIRVVEGVDISSYRDAGLGSSYVFSRGPNASVREAGSYAFDNMGASTGDYGLWRSLCRNTVDGYTYAIPMFLVTRRNQQAYNADTNINGSSIDSIGAIRPDGLTYEDIVQDDILDIRRKTGNVDTSALLGSAFDALMEGSLATSMIREPSKGGQAGSLLTYVDKISQGNLEALANGDINSEAVGGITGFAQGSQQDETGALSLPGFSGPPVTAEFAPLVNGLYNHDPSYYHALYSVTQDGPVGIEGSDIPGYFTGMGTPQAVFVFGETGVYEGEGVNYVVQGAYIDYGSPGLSKIPDSPLQIKNVVQGSPASSYNYYGIDRDVESKVVRRLNGGIPGYTNYVEATATGFGGNVQQNASMFRLHIYQEILANTTEIRIPKNNEGYFVYAVREIRNLVDGGVYKVSSVVDRAGSDTSVLVVNLANTYTIAEGSYIEIIAEITTLETEASGITTQSIGQSTDDRGESIDAYRSPYLSVFDSAIKGVYKSYKCVLLVKSASGSTSVTFPNEKVVGLATMNYLDGNSKPTVWLATNTPYTTVPVDSVEYDSEGYITSITGTAFADGLIIVAVIQEITEFQNAAGNASAIVTYKSRAPQTLGPLPSTLSVEMIDGPSSFVISSQGTGGGIRSSMYKNPLEQIPVADNLSNPSYFFNLYGLELNTFLEEEGYLTMPFRVSRRPSGVLTLSEPSVDRLGRSYYGSASKTMVFKTEGMMLGNPRKLMIPFLVRVRSQITSPALYGEVLMAVVTSYENTSLDNELIAGPDGNAIIALYKVPGMPLIR